MNFISITLLGVATILPPSTASSPSCLPCIDRSKVSIGVVHHGHIQDPYWDAMDIAIKQGAKDMGINLIMRDHPIDETSQDEINSIMKKEIEEYCTDGEVDALLVSLPNAQVLESLGPCLQKDHMPVAVFNSGYDLAKRDGLFFFGMDERKGGYAAGKELASIEEVETFCCANHVAGHAVLDARCGGFDQAIEDLGKTPALQDVEIDHSDCESWITEVERQCEPGNGDWSTVGLYAAGEPNHNCLVEFMVKHPDTQAAASDVSPELFTGMEAGMNIKFGIDHQKYLQAYLPFSHLTLAVTNGQMIKNTHLETGPNLIREAPSQDTTDCTENDYKVCNDETSGVFRSIA